MELIFEETEETKLLKSQLLQLSKMDYKNIEIDKKVLIDRLSLITPLPSVKLENKERFMKYGKKNKKS